MTDRRSTFRPRKRIAAEWTDTPQDAIRLMHDAAAGRAAWDEIRSRCIRAMTGERTTAEQAVRMFEAFRRKPVYLPSLPPLQQ